MKGTENLKLLRVTTVPMSLRFLLRGQMKYMASRGIQVKMASSPGNELPDVIAYENCDHKPFPFTRFITPFKDLQALIQLVRWLRSERFDIVHSHTPKAGLLAMMASYVVRVPIRAHTIAGIPWMESKGIKRSILKMVDKLAYVCATNVYPNSKELEKFVLKEKLVAKSKLKVLGNGSTNGIETTFFSPESIELTKPELRQKYGIPQNAFVYIFVGRIVKDKGMNELAQAFAEFSSDCHLILVGPLEQELDPIAQESMEFFNSASNVQMMGYQNDVRPFLKMADALVFPSYREGFPNVPLQAGAMGLPSIVTDINGCNEIVADKQNGLIIPVKDVGALKEAMQLLITDPDLMNQMKAMSRKMVVDRYAQGVVWEALYQEYGYLKKELLNV